MISDKIVTPKPQTEYWAEFFSETGLLKAQFQASLNL
jgi:hypothetical protein